MSGKCPFQLIDENRQPFTPESHPIRSDIPTLPTTMQHLPIDERGYPVPFFVTWINKKPEFRGATRQAVALAIKHDLCWVCGTPLRSTRVFVIGPMCAVNRISSEPPSHIECARYSAIACPFLSKPQMVRRENDLPSDKLPSPGVMITRNPGVTLLWFVRGQADYKIESYPEGQLWHFQREPTGTEWYCRGQVATRTEIMDSITSGLPALYEAAALDGSTPLIEGSLSRAMKLLPH